MAKKAKKAKTAKKAKRPAGKRDLVKAKNATMFAKRTTKGWLIDREAGQVKSRLEGSGVALVYLIRGG